MSFVGTSMCLSFYGKYLFVLIHFIKIYQGHFYLPTKHFFACIYKTRQKKLLVQKINRSVCIWNTIF